MINQNREETEMNKVTVELTKRQCEAILEALSNQEIHYSDEKDTVQQLVVIRAAMAIRKAWHDKFIKKGKSK